MLIRRIDVNSLTSNQNQFLYRWFYDKKNSTKAKAVRIGKNLKAPAPANGITIQEAVSIIGGITGTIVAILWLAGRSIWRDTCAINIPAFQINFSVWEYAEVPA